MKFTHSYKLFILTIISTFFLLFSFAGCSNREPFEGEICNLEYQPAYTTTSLIPIIISNGKTVTTILVPYILYYPDRWYVQVREYVEEDEEFVYHECWVTEEVFTSLNIGDWFVYNADYCFPDEPCEKVRLDE